jgi:hypothetical protein
MEYQEPHEGVNDVCKDLLCEQAWPVTGSVIKGHALTNAAGGWWKCFVVFVRVVGVHHRRYTCCLKFSSVPEGSLRFVVFFLINPLCKVELANSPNWPIRW